MITVYGYNMAHHEGKVEIQTVPFKDGEVHLINPTCKLGMESTGSFTFSVEPYDEYYHDFKQMKTFISIDYDGDIIFYGRVLTINHGFYGERKITCEGAISLLLDTYYEGKEESERDEITAGEWIKKLIENHNQQVSYDHFKGFYPGEIPGNYSDSIDEIQKIENAEKQFGSSSWTQTKSALDDLKSHYGGCWRARVDSDGKLRLDWLDQYFSGSVNPQKISIGKNVIDASKTSEVDNIFTVVIPIGKNDTDIKGYRTDVHGEGVGFKIPDLTKYYDDSDLNSGYHKKEDYLGAFERYGEIVKVVTFSDKDTQKDLFEAAMKWAKNNFYGSVDSYTVKAIDFSLLNSGGETQGSGSSSSNSSNSSFDYATRIKVGDRVEVEFPEMEEHLEGEGDSESEENNTIAKIITRTLTCLEIEYDLYNPQNNSYKFGIPAMCLTKNYTASGSSVSSSASDSGTDPTEDPKDTQTDQDKWFEQVCSYLKSHKVWNKSVGHPDGPATSDGRSPTILRSAPSMSTDGSGKTQWYLWKPVVKSRMGSSLSKVIFDNDEQGRPRGAWQLLNNSQLTWTTVSSYCLVPYIIQEWGYNICTDGSTEMPSVVADTTDGSIEILSVVEDLTGGDNLISKVMDYSGGLSKVLGVFNSNGDKVAQVETDDGTIKFAKVGDDGKIVTDADGNIVYLSIREVFHTTSELKEALEAMGVQVDLLDGQVTLIGRELGDSSYGLIYDLAAMGITVASISDQVVLIGQTVGDNTRGLIYDLALMDKTVANISNDVVILGQEMHSSTAGLVYDLALMGKNVITLTGDVNLLGQKVGNETYGLIYDLASLGVDVTALTSKVTLIGEDVGDSTRGLIYDLAQMGKNVVALTGDVNLIGKTVGNETSGLIYRLASLDGDVSAMTSKVNIIGQNVGNETSGLIYQLASLDGDVSAMTSKVNIIGQNVGNETSGLIYRLASLDGDVSAMTSKVNIIGQNVGNETSGLIYQLATLDGDVTALTSKVNIIGNNVGNETSGLIYNLAMLDKSVTALTGNVNIIGATVGNDTAGLVYDLAQQGISVTLLADDLVYFTGELNGAKARIGSIESKYITADYISASLIQSKIGDIDQLMVQDVRTSATDGKAWFNTYYGKSFVYQVPAGGGYYQNVELASGISNMRVEYDETTEMYTLQFQRLNDSAWTDAGTFNRAASGGITIEDLTGSWSGSTLTVSTVPSTGKTYSVGFSQFDDEQLSLHPDGTASINSSDSTKLDVPIKLCTTEYVSSTDPYHLTTRYSETFTVNAKSVYDASRNNIYLKCDWDAGTFTVNAKDINTDASISGKSISRSLASGSKENQDGTSYTTGKIFYIPINATYGTGTSYTSESTGYRVRVDASNVYTSGKSAIYLSGSWNSGVYTVVAKDSDTDADISGKTISRTLASGSKENQDGSSYTNGKIFYIPINATYGTAPNITTESTGYRVRVDASNVYTSGKSAIYLSGSWNSGVYTVVAKDSDTDADISGKTISRSLASGSKENEDGTAYTSGNVFYIPINATYGTAPNIITESTGYRVRIDASNVYTSAKNDVEVKSNSDGSAYFTANSQSGSTLPSSRTFTYTTNAPSPKASASKSNTWYLVQPDAWSSNTKTITLRVGSTTGTAYAQTIVDASTLVTSAATTAKNDVEVKSNSDGSAYFTANSQSGSTLPSSRTFTYTTNAPSPKASASKSNTWYLVQPDDWSSNTKTITLRVGSTTGTAYAQTIVDASTLVTNATNAGKYIGKASVNLTDMSYASWTTSLPTSQTISCSTTGRTNSSGTTDDITKTLKLYLTQGSWSSSNTLNVSLRTTSTTGTEIAQTIVDASTLVTNATNAGKYIGKASVNLTDMSYASWTTSLPTSQTISCSTTGRTNSSGTTDDITKTLKLYLTQGSWSSSNTLNISLRTTSTTGTEIAQTTVNASTLVTNATNAGKASVNLTDMSYASWTGDPPDNQTISCSTTGRTNSSGTNDPITKTLKLYLTQSSSWSSTNTKNVALKTVSTSGTTIARVTVDASALVTSAATTAKNDVEVKSNSDGSAYFTANSQSGSTLPSSRTFTYTTNAPSPKASASKSNTWYLVQPDAWSSNTKTITLRVGSTTGTAYAQTIVDASTLVTNATNAGKASVNLTDMSYASWTGDPPDNQTISCSTTGRTNSSGTNDPITKTLKLYLTQSSSWSSTNTKNVALKTVSTSGTTIARVTVDASALVSDAINSVGVKGSWSGNVYTVIPTTSSSYTSRTCEVAAAASISYNSSTHKYTATAKAQGNATVRDTATIESGLEAYYAGKASVSLTDMTWTAVTSSNYPDNQTITCKTSGRTNTSGTTSESSKTLKLYLTQGTWPTSVTSSSTINVNLRTTSTSGTIIARTVVSGTTVYNAAYEAGWKAGWNAYYSDSADWIQAWSEGNNTYGVYIPRRQGTATGYYDFYNASTRGKGNGSNSTCQQWFTYSSTGSVTHSITVSTKLYTAGTTYSTGAINGGTIYKNDLVLGKYYEIAVKCGGTTKIIYFSCKSSAT